MHLAIFETSLTLGQHLEKLRVADDDEDFFRSREEPGFEALDALLKCLVGLVRRQLTRLGAIRTAAFVAPCLLYTSPSPRD